VNLPLKPSSREADSQSGEKKEGCHADATPLLLFAQVFT